MVVVIELVFGLTAWTTGLIEGLAGMIWADVSMPMWCSRVASLASPPGLPADV